MALHFLFLQEQWREVSTCFVFVACVSLCVLGKKGGGKRGEDIDVFWHRRKRPAMFVCGPPTIVACGLFGKEQTPEMLWRDVATAFLRAAFAYFILVCKRVARATHV